MSNTPLLGTNMPTDLHSFHGRKSLGTASFSSSFINLANTIIGAGVLAMPHAYASLGWLGGSFIILFAATTAGFGLYLLTRCAKYVDRGSASFFSIAQKTYPSAAIVFDLAIALKTFGVAVSYLIIISNLMPQIVHAALPGSPPASGGGIVPIDEIGLLVDRRFWLTVFMTVIIPLSFLRKLDSLKYTSIISLFAIGYLVILVVGHWIIGDTIPLRGEIDVITWKGPVQFLASLPVFVFAFTCHQNIFAIVNEINDDSQECINWVLATAIGGSTFVYLLVATTGYMSFGGNVNGNIVSMYPNSITANIGRAAIVILILFSYPLQAHPCRNSLDKVMRALSTTPSSDSGEISSRRWTWLTISILLATYSVAFAVSSLETVLSYVGSTGSTAISFILPGAFYWKITSPDYDLIPEDETIVGQIRRLSVGRRNSVGSVEVNKEKGRRIKLMRTAAGALAFYGVCFMISSLSLNIYGSLNGIHPH